MKCLTILTMAGAMLASHPIHATLSVVGVYAAGDENTVNFSMGYSGNTTWTTGIGQVLGAAQIRTLGQFEVLIGEAFAAGRGGVVDFEGVAPSDYNQVQSFGVSFAGGAKQMTLSNRIDGNYSVAGPMGDRTGVSGSQFLGTGGSPHFELSFTEFVGFEPDEKVVAVGLTVLGRNNQGTGRNFRVVARYTNGVETGSSSTFRGFNMQSGNGTQDSFSGIVAPDGYWITSLRLHSDQNIFTSVDDLAFITDIVSSVIDYDAPYALNFGQGAGRTPDIGLVVSDGDSFELRQNSLVYRPVGDAFVPAVALTHVANYREEESFRLSASILVEEAPAGPDHRVGLAILGGAGGTSFDAEDNSDFYGLVWTPGEAGSSVLEIREGFDGAILASAPWLGGAPTASDLGQVFFDDFENGGEGWTSGGAGNIWEVGAPVAGFGPASGAFSGLNVAATGLDAKYGIDANAWFRSPVIDLTGALAAELRFREYTELEDFGINGEFHYTKVAILDASSNQQLVELARYNDQTGDWRLREFTLPSEVLGRRVVVEFRLFSDDLDGDIFDGWFLDDVEVLAAEAPVYQFLADGFFRADGSLTLGFTLVDGDALAQTVSATVAEPLFGKLFGPGGRSRTEGGLVPEFGFLSLSMDTGPFNYLFGSDFGRDSGDSFEKTRAADWTVQADSLLVAATAPELVDSLAVNQIRYFEPGEQRFLEVRFGSPSVGSGESDSRVAVVLYGAVDSAGFDPAAEESYYTFQWIPNRADGGSVSVRQGMDGAILAGVNLADLKRPPELTAGGSYRFRLLQSFPESGGIRFWGSLTDGRGGEAAVAGMLPEVPSGNGFGFGARHQSGVSPEWAFESWTWSDEDPLPLPVDRRFGTMAGRDSIAGFTAFAGGPGGFLLGAESVRLLRPDRTILGDQPMSGLSAETFYTPGQDFVMRTNVVTDALPPAEPILSFIRGDVPENQVEVPTSGLQLEAGTVAVSFNLRAGGGGTLIGHVSPRNNFSNRIYITTQNQDPTTIRLGSTPEVSIGLVPEVDRWYHVALAWERAVATEGNPTPTGGTFRAFVDGVEAASGEYGGLAQLSDVLEFGNIGHSTRNEYAPNAFLRNGSAWNRALTEGEVLQIVNGLSGNEEGLVGYWPMNEGAGDTVNDLSGNNNNGLITGAQWIDPISQAPAFGLSALGTGTDPASAYTFEWLPGADGSVGFLRIAAPAGSAISTLDLSTVAGAPGSWAKGTLYTMTLGASYEEDGSLELAGTLSDGDENEATLSVVLGGAGVELPGGTWFGLTGRNSRLDWRGFQLASPAQFALLGPIEPEGWTFALWGAINFSPEELADPSISGPLAAPAGDGISNLLKYAFGLDPLTPVSSTDLPQPERVDGALRLTYRELWEALDIEYIPELSQDLMGWDGEDVVEINRVTDGDYDLVTVEAVLPEGSPRAFLRVMVRQTD
jgi:hypothetical protein